MHVKNLNLCCAYYSAVVSVACAVAVALCTAGVGCQRHVLARPHEQRRKADGGVEAEVEQLRGMRHGDVVGLVAQDDAAVEAQERGKAGEDGEQAPEAPQQRELELRGIAAPSRRSGPRERTCSTPGLRREHLGYEHIAVVGWQAAPWCGLASPSTPSSAAARPQRPRSGLRTWRAPAAGAAGRPPARHRMLRDKGGSRGRAFRWC